MPLTPRVEHNGEQVPAIVSDCREPQANCREYFVRIDGKWTLQNRRFNRGDMAYLGFSVGDVRYDGSLENYIEEGEFIK